MIELRNVSKIYPDNQVAVKDLSLTVNEDETVVLIGPSGCGKTTTLKMINRLIEPSGGEILVNGENILTQNPINLRRDIGYVIQKIGLFPHMTIQENITIVPTLMGWSSTKKRNRANELMSLMGLAPEVYSDRLPGELSGGQQQRVGVARALAADPPILLMDEPFGALDPITRRDLQEEFQNLKKRIKKTIVFVTHDIIEAVTLGDKIGVMNKGKLMQFGPPQEILHKPESPIVQRITGHQLFQLTLSAETIQGAVEEQTWEAPVDILKERVQSVRQQMEQKEADILTVVDRNGKLITSIPHEELSRTKGATEVDKIVPSFPHTIDENISLLTALNEMIENNADVLPVISNEGLLRGLLYRKTLLREIDNIFAGSRSQADSNRGLPKENDG
jgi:osmoprotectant transport system ATP-binding protein